MRKVKQGIIGFVIITVFIWAAISAAQGQGYRNVLALFAGETFEVSCVDASALTIEQMAGDMVAGACVANATAAPTATSTVAVSTATPTNTPLPPTPTSTAAPPTSTPVVSTTPVAGAPLCQSHDPTVWHGLWDSNRGCHYDHEHGINPAVMSTVFGPWGAQWGGQQISYPWQTFHTMDGVTHYENDTKHGGYKIWAGWLTASSDNNLNIAQAQTRIVAARYEHHAKGGNDPSVRKHSFFSEFLVCQFGAITGTTNGLYDLAKIDLSRCGIVRVGGWDDYGYAHVPYKTSFAKTDPTPGTEFGLPWPPQQSIHSDPYRAARPCNEGSDKWENDWAQCKTCGQVSDLGRDNWQLWTTQPGGGYGSHPYGGLHVIRFDAPTCFVSQGGIAVEQYIDQQVGHPTRFNNTEHSPFRLWAGVPASWDGTATDADGKRDGFVTFGGYTTPNGALANCAAPGPDCVPFQLQNVPVGWAGWVVPSDNGKDMRLINDGDVSPGSEWWINPEVN